MERNECWCISSKASFGYPIDRTVFKIKVDPLYDLCSKNITSHINVFCSAANCANGHGYNYTSGTCMECPRGTYRIRVEALTVPLTPRCVPCPAGRTTERTGSLTKDQCTIGTYHECISLSAS